MQNSIKSIVEGNYENFLKKDASYIALFKSEGIYENLELIKNCIIADQAFPQHILAQFNEYIYKFFLEDIIGIKPRDSIEQNRWYFKSNTLRQFLTLQNPYPLFASDLLTHLLQSHSVKYLNEGLEFLKSIQFNEIVFCKLLAHRNHFSCLRYNENIRELNIVGGILNLEKQRKTFLGFGGKKTCYLNDLLESLSSNSEHFSNFANGNLDYIIKYHPEQIDLYFENWILYENKSNNGKVNYYNVKLLLDYNNSYLPKINELFIKRITNKITQIEALYFLKELFSFDNTNVFNDLIKEVFTNYDVQIEKQISFQHINTLNLYAYVVAYLKSQFSAQLEQLLINNLKSGKSYHTAFYEALINDNPSEFSLFLQEGYQILRKEQSYFAENLFPIFNSQSIELHKAFHWQGIQNENHRTFKNFHLKELLRSEITIMDEAKALLSNGKVNQRIAAVSVLSHSKRIEDLELLAQTAINEQNDDTRDIIVPIIFKQIYPSNLKLKDIKKMIDSADKRKKLKPNKLRQLFSESIANVFWIDGSKLTEQEINFLFYRTSRSTEKLSDLELKLACRFIDKEKSIHFSKMVLNKFTETNSDVKYKQLMILAALAGNDSLIQVFDALFQKSIQENRVKLAEMIIPKVMSIGSNTALRWVEQISRKLKSKKPLIASLARETLDYAAEELGIDSEELSDKIIPDFGFENLQKTIESDGETYTAFIDFNLSLVFYDVDNKLYKSVPKTFSKELKSELAAMQKEIKAIGKYQESRLFDLMVQEKTWTKQYWMDHFLLQPVIFVFTRQLIWMECDKEGNAINTFRCDEDASLINFNEDDITLKDENLIKIYHPALVDENTKTQWREYFFKSKLKSLFDQVNRLVFIKNTEQDFETHINKLIANPRETNSEKIKSTMVKNGWIKSTGDGGTIDFIKNFKWLELRANVWFNNVFAYYEPTLNGTLEIVDFYDMKNNKSIKSTDLPPVIYSEILFDLNFLHNTEIDK